jgi:hypothetical protein
MPTFDIIFSENVKNFTSSDIITTNGSITSITETGNIRNIIFNSNTNNMIHSNYKL